MKAALETIPMPREYDGLRRKRKARERKPRRLFNAQRPRREAEVRSRKRAVAIARIIMANGGTQEEAAASLQTSSRTLRNWNRQHKQHRLEPNLRGRRIKELDYKTRTDILEVLNLMGPRVGMPTLKPLFPKVPRTALRSRLHRFRDVKLYYEQKGMYTLTWTRPGAVWAMDHKDRTTMPIDGEHKFAFANRDLGADYQVDWLSVELKDADTVNKILEARYKEHGPPLVQKGDWGFAAKSTMKVFDKWDVFFLLSPEHYPKYNGSIEAGVNSMTVRTDHHAMRNGRPGEWSCGDCETGRLEANETSRPRGSNGPVPDEVWQNREPISDEERAAFKAAVLKARRWWKIHVVGRKPEAEITRSEEAEIMRKSIQSALTTLGYLRQRRGYFSTTSSPESGKQ
jgi:hypothetical protein